MAASRVSAEAVPWPRAACRQAIASAVQMRLLISYSGVLGGAERALLELADALGEETSLACPRGALADAARARGLRVFALPDRSLELRAQRLLAAGRLAAHAREARALVDALEPDLVVAWGMRSALALWLAGVSRSAQVVFAHNDFLPGPIIGMLVRRAAAAADRVLVPSAAVATDLDPTGRLADKIAVVNPAVEVESFAGLNGRPADPPEVLVLGALVDWKRPDLALEALAIARARRPELRLRLVGAPLGEAAEQLSERLRWRASQPDLEGAVEFVGPIADPRPELTRATCLLHCAPQEPFGLALVESLAAGRPVVAPDAAGPAEIVDPSCGILYPPGDARAAAAGVLRLLDDPAQAAAMGSRGRERARDRFDVTRSRSRFAALAAPPGPGRPPARREAAQALALVTVTHNSSSELERLLESVARHLPGTRVVVVDSASEDQSREVARKARAGIATELIALESNEGFGAGCNRGVAAVSEPVTALLNPDVELVDDSLLALVEEALRPAAPERLLAPLVLSEDGSRQDTVHSRPGSSPELARALIPPALAAGLLGPALGLAPERSRRPRRVGWAVACALVARTDTLVRLGPFDERIFLYGEDLDLGLRARELGIETWFWPRARLIHSRAHATAPAFGGEPFELLARARHDAVARRLGARYARLDDAAQAVTFSSRRVLKRILGREAERERHQLAAIRTVRGSR
jgi:N-acetylglucosaminyl-diphospho-decaprenol L-rhamnosyltransferase